MTSQDTTWHSQFDYETAIETARLRDLPILLFFRSASCSGSRRLDAEVFSAPEVAARIREKVVPVVVDVETQRPDPITSAIVGSHIFIMSQSLQLVSPDGDIFHKLLGAPRCTRLDLGYTRVHVDLLGTLTAAEFLEQLDLGLAKRALFRGEYRAARAAFAAVRERAAPRKAARHEAEYWLPIAASNGVYPGDATRRDTPTKSPLARSVERFCEALVRVPDEQLMADWRGKPAEGDWSHYSDCLREVTLGLHQGLTTAALEAEGWRAANGRIPTSAHRILGKHHAAYRHLHGLIVGLSGRVLDQIHLRENYSAGKQRTIRNNLVHCVMAESWAHGSQIRNTLRQVRGLPVDTSPIEATIARLGEPPQNFGDMGKFIARWETLHAQMIDELTDVTDAELETSAAWWENSPVTLRFRMNRLGWHLHDHAAVVETILERLGRVRTETERLAQLLHRALGDLEAALIGLSPSEQARFLDPVTATMNARAIELEGLALGRVTDRAVA